MGKRKSTRPKPPSKKPMKLDKCFTCPFCSHPSTVERDMDWKHMIGQAFCYICKESYSTIINDYREQNIGGVWERSGGGFFDWKIADMGRLYLINLEGKIYSCKHCSTISGSTRTSSPRKLYMCLHYVRISWASKVKFEDQAVCPISTPTSGQRRQGSRSSHTTSEQVAEMYRAQNFNHPNNEEDEVDDYSTHNYINF